MLCCLHGRSRRAGLWPSVLSFFFPFPSFLLSFSHSRCSADSSPLTVAALVLNCPRLSRAARSMTVTTTAVTCGPLHPSESPDATTTPLLAPCKYPAPPHYLACKCHPSSFAGSNPGKFHSQKVKVNYLPREAPSARRSRNLFGAASAEPMQPSSASASRMSPPPIPTDARSRNAPSAGQGNTVFSPTNNPADKCTNSPHFHQAP